MSALHERYPGRLSVWIVDIFTQIAPSAFHTLPAQYAFFAAHPPLWRAAWEYSRFPPARAATEAVVHALLRRRLAAAYAAYAPDLVLSVHPLCQTLPLRVLRSATPPFPGATDVPFVTVVTDLGGAHPTWFHPGVDRCFVPSPAVAAVARRCGLADGQVRVLGLPVRSAFWAPPADPGAPGGGGGEGVGEWLAWLWRPALRRRGARGGAGDGAAATATTVDADGRIRPTVGAGAGSNGAASVLAALPPATVPVVLRPPGGGGAFPLCPAASVATTSTGGPGDPPRGSSSRPPETPKSRLRRSLSLRPHTPTVLVVGGGDGVGGLAALTTTLTASLAADRGATGAQVVVVCGRNAGLAASLAARPDWPVPVTVAGHVDAAAMSAWMAAADVLVTKAGPGTIAEALIRGLPMVLSGYLPGQERPNVAYVVDAGVGRYAGGKGGRAGGGGGGNGGG